MTRPGNVLLSRRVGVSLLALLIAMLAVIAAAPRLAQADAPAGQPTDIGIVAPANASLGQHVLLQAHLVGPGGAGISGAPVQFTSPAQFLDTTSDAVLGEATTDRTGLAKLDYVVRRTGTLEINAVFAGNQTYSASHANAQLTVTGSGQLYVQDAGVKIPGLNATSTHQVGGWPHWALSGWPIALVLAIVWALYGTAVFFMSRIATADEAGTEAS